MKTITMKNSFVSSWSHVVAIGSIASLAFFAACGDNVTDNDPVATQAYEGQEDFPDCDEDYEGMFATVKSKQELYICTAEKWVNLTTGAVVSDKGGSGNTGCTSKELADKSGVTVICNGDSVAVLKYGKDGAKGSTGPSGDDGGKGSDGEDGHDGGSGKDAKMDPSRCLLKYSGLDVTVYDCADSTYVETQSMATTSTVPWKVDFTATTLTIPSFGGSKPQFVYHGLEGATGSLERYEGDVLDLSSPVSFSSSLAIKGNATVEVTTAQTVTADKYRPFVGVRFTYSSAGTNIASRGGVCVTYSSAEDMNVLIEGETGFLKASLPATENDEVAVKDFAWLDFEPVVEGVDLEKALSKAKYAYVEAAGGTDIGSYENKFSVYQFGNYGNCDETTYKSNALVETLLAKVSPAASVTYGGVTYKAVTIGNQTWLAENLRVKTANSICYYSSDDTDCSTYGRAYSWADALGSDATDYGCSDEAVCEDILPSIVQGICPDGWHLPSISEWGALISEIMEGSGYTGFYGTTKPDAAPTYLRLALLSEKSSIYGLDNLLGMNIFEPSDGGNILMWSATEHNASNAETMYYLPSSSNGYIKGDLQGDSYTGKNYKGWYGSKATKRPVRCVKN